MSKRVLITVSGGVADYVADDGVEIFLFDFDNYRAGDEIIVPKQFAAFADYMGVPDECIEQ